MNIKEIIGDYNIFLDKIMLNLDKIGIDSFDLLEIDHICFRVNSYERYDVKKGELENFGELRSENIISGRPIAIYELNEPLVYGEYIIKCVEIPAPKENKHYIEELEHAEFVIKISLKEFLEKYKNIDFNMSASEREINPEIIIDFGDCAVKFHEEGILDVVKRREESK